MGDRFRGPTAIQRANQQALVDWDKPEAVAERARREARAVAHRNTLHKFLYGGPDEPDLHPVDSHWDRERFDREEWGR